MKLGTLKALDRKLLTATGAQGVALERDLGAWFADLAVWTPATPREIVQACAIARHLLDHAQVPEGEALGELRACLYGIATCARAGSAGTARAMRLLPQTGARAGLDPAHDGPEVDALAAIARGARPLTRRPGAGRTGVGRRAA